MRMVVVVVVVRIMREAAIFYEWIHLIISLFLSLRTQRPGNPIFWSSGWIHARHHGTRKSQDVGPLDLTITLWDNLPWDNFLCDNRLRPVE